MTVDEKNKIIQGVDSKYCDQNGDLPVFVSELLSDYSDVVTNRIGCVNEFV